MTPASNGLSVKGKETFAKNLLDIIEETAQLNTKEGRLALRMLKHARKITQEELAA